MHALDKRGCRVAFFKPVGQTLARDTGPERSTHFVACTPSLRPSMSEWPTNRMPFDAMG